MTDWANERPEALLLCDSDRWSFVFDLSSLLGEGRATIRRAALICILLLAVAARAQALDGRALYLRHCADCHGASGRGDGADASLFAPPPQDLRRAEVAAMPSAEVVQRILGSRDQTLALDLPTLKARAVEADAVATYLQRLPHVDWANADAGQELYLERCAACHGRFGVPPASLPAGVQAPADLSDPSVQRRLGQADLIAAMRHGRAGMPALTPRLSDAEARQVAAFVALLSPGHTTYAQYCAQCHGDHGIPAGSFGEAFPQPAVSFDRAYFARQDPDKLRLSIWHMLDRRPPAMPHFRATLSEAQVRAIVESLKDLPQ